MNSPAGKSATRLRAEIAALLKDFPDQLLALQSAMEEFGENFELSAFKTAFERRSGMKAYNDVQAVERAFARVQNYIAQLSLNGAQLAEFDLPKRHASEVSRAFEALKNAGAIDASLCRQLKRTQKARAAIEHEYTKVSAGRVHLAAQSVAEAAPRFIVAYAAWIEPYL